MWLFIGLLSQPDLFPRRPLGWSRFQFLSVLKPGCLSLFEVFSRWGQVLSAEVSHSPIGRRPKLTVLGQDSHSVFRTSLLSLPCHPFLPCENVNPCWQCKERKQKNLRFKACLGYRAQNSLNNNKKSKILFPKELGVEMSGSALA